MAAEKVDTLKNLPHYAFDQLGTIYGPVDPGEGTFVRHEDLVLALGERQETAEPPPSLSELADGLRRKGEAEDAAEKVKRLSRNFAAEWCRPDDPDHATGTLVDTLSTAMLAFHAVARGVELRLAAHREGPATAEPQESTRSLTYVDLYTRLRGLVKAKRYKEAFDFVREPITAASVHPPALTLDRLRELAGPTVARPPAAEKLEAEASKPSDAEIDLAYCADILRFDMTDPFIEGVPHADLPTTDKLKPNMVAFSLYGAVKELRELRVAVAEPATWQPIDTAPKDGTTVLVAMLSERDGNERIYRVSEAAFNGLGWYDRSGTNCHWRTHWTPMPQKAAPQEKPE